nr:roadblock/LC7 domain-containing protein [uncultured Desulfuromonas sp.]
MPFKHLLTPLLDSGQGVNCAIIADWDGEAVDWLPLQREMDDLKIFGAHQGILLSHFRRCLDINCFGAIEEIMIRTEGVDWFVFPITTEYYLALCADSDRFSSMIRRLARKCIEGLRLEFEEI